MRLSEFSSLETSRSKYSQRIFELAKESNLFFFDFSLRKEVEKPMDWGADITANWEKGNLIEHKYSHFRNDLMIGSFNPAHRAKWTTHEICHNLLGFAWQPEASFYFHSIAARISELLPVCLYYFLEEVGLRRCPKHFYSGALYSEYCLACEKLAANISDEREDEKLYTAKLFYQQEMRAIKSSIKEGIWRENSLFGLNLSTDAVTYASQQYLRLSDPLFSKFIEAFHTPQKTVNSSLDELIERSDLLYKSILSADKFPAWEVSEEYWVCTDLAWRILQLSKLCEGSELETKLQKLVFSELTNFSKAGIERCILNYENLYEEYECLAPEALFATGYRLNDQYGYALDQVVEGLESIAPHSLKKLEDSHIDSDLLFKDFVFGSKPRRENMGTSFSSFLKDKNQESLSRLFFLESELNSPLSPDNLASLSIFSEDAYKVFSISVDTKILSCTTHEGQSLGFDFEIDSDDLVLLARGEGEAMKIFPLAKKEWQALHQGEGLLEFKLEQEVLKEELILSGFILPAKWETRE